MKLFVAVLMLCAVPALAQESSNGSLFDALKTGDWVTYTSGTTRDLIDVSVIEKPANTTIRRHREELTVAQRDARVARSKYTEAMNALRRENLADDEREAKEAALHAELEKALESLPAGVRRTTARDTSARSAGRSAFSDSARPTQFPPTTRPYEVTAIRKEYLVLSDGTSEEFVAKSAIRLIRRRLPSDTQRNTTDPDADEKKKG
jgi:hypothetical protein